MRDRLVAQPALACARLALFVVVLAGGAIPLRAAPSTTAIVLGSVADDAGRPVAAAVQIGGRTLHSAADGAIPRTPLPIAGPTELVDVVVSAPGFAPWRYAGVELAADHPVELRVVLGQEPVVFPPAPAVGPAAVPFDGPPDYVNVGRTFSTSCVYPPTNVQRVDRVPFIDYVRNVLPNEWVASWPDAALEAGAVAAAQFAWSTAFVNRKWTGRGYAFDVLDSTCDQVYKDRSGTANYGRSDAAVARMWGVALTRNNKLFTTFFRDTDARCDSNAGTKDCMGQWGSYYRAQEGLDSLAILHYYYDRVAPSTDVRTAPALRGLALQRSPDVTLTPGASSTLALCMRNVGSTAWQSGVTNLVAVDPANPANSAYVSPFANVSWRTTQQPATVKEASAPLGSSGTWSFTITAPANLAPGTYQLAVQPRQAGGTAVPTDAPIVWTINVAGNTSTYSNRVLLPLIQRPPLTTTPRASCP